MRVVLFLEGLASHFGPGSQCVLLARGLKERGHEVVLLVQNPVDDANQYLADLKCSGIPVFCPSWLVALLDQAAWTNRIFLALLIPLRLPLALGSMLVQKRNWKRAWRGVAGRINRYLPAKPILHWSWIWASRRLSRLYQQRCFDIVHTFSGTGMVFNWAQEHAVPLVYNENGIPTDEFGVDWWPEMRTHADDVSLTISVCAAAKIAIRQFLGYKGPIAVIPCMVDTPVPDSGILRQWLARSEDEIIIGTAGRLDVRKGQRVLLHAFALLQRTKPDCDIRLWVAGDGEDRDALKATASALGIVDRVVFVGALDAQEMAAFYERLDIFVLPSLWEGLPVVVLEAMAHGRAVIATDAGGVAEAVEDGATGLLVPPRDPQALADALLSLVLDPGLRIDLARSGRDRWQRCYAPQVVVDAIVDAYRQVLSNRQLIERTSCYAREHG